MTLGRKVKQEAITLNAKGSAVAELNLPSNALTGLWTASLAIPGNEEIFRVTNCGSVWNTAEFPE